MCRSRGLVSPCLARGVIPEAVFSYGITLTTASSLSCNDGRILVELQWWPDGRRCQRAVQSLASDHFRLLGERGVSDPPLLSDRKITSWDTRLEVLGWIIDTEVLTVTLPPHKRGNVCELLAAWPASRASASAKQVSKLVGFLMHISFAISLGSFFGSVCWPRWGCRASPLALTSRAVPETLGAGSFSGPSSTGTSAFGVGSLLRSLTCGGVACRLRCNTCSSARPDVLCFRMLPKR